MYDSICSDAHKLRLFGMHASIKRRCEQAVAENLHPSELLKLLFEDERLQRKNTLAKRLTTRAKFRSQCDLDNWDHSHNRGLSSAKLKELSLLNFYHNKQNLLILGSTGVGKTHLAIALGRILCQEQASVNFFSVNLFFETIQAEKAAGRYLAFLKKIAKIDVLILDDFALRMYSHSEANELLEILEERYASRVTIITSQVSPKGWMNLFEDQVIAQAIVDRMENPSELITLKGESYRRKRGSN